MNDQFSLEGRNVIVTGAGQGIGKAISKTAVELGAKVVGVDLNAATIDAVQNELGADRFQAVIGNVAVPETAGKAVEACHLHFGDIHGLVTMPGSSSPQ